MADPPLLATLFENPLFAGGAGLATLGAAAAFARRAGLVTAAALRRRLLVNVEIARHDPAYPWILAWLARPRPEPTGFVASRLTRIHNLSVTTAISGSGTSSSNTNSPNGGLVARFQLQPGYGRHVVRHGGAYIAVARERGSTANMNTGEPHETVLMTTLWAHRHVFESVFAEAHALAARAREGRTVVYTARGPDWVPLGEPRRKRPLDSVVLDRGVTERVLADVRDFLARQRWYLDRGIPYRRGYLLHGPPGGGKSSFIQALAAELDYAVAAANLSEVGMTDDKLAHLLTRLPRRTILLLEDADAAFANRRRRDPDGYAGATVTFSGLLNALDGVVAGEERIAFLTTNHADRLDPALVRPGRVDVTVRVGEPTRYQAGRMWERFYGDADPDGRARARFLFRLEELDLFDDDDHDHNDDEGGVEGRSPPRKTVKRSTSTAAIQGLFLLNKEDMEGAIAMAEEVLVAPASEGPPTAPAGSRFGPATAVDAVAAVPTPVK